MPLPNTRYTLLRRLGEADDPAAWAEFCEVYEPAIRRIAGRYGLQDADAREVTQEVLLTVSRKIAMFDPAAGGRFRSWLAAIARNTTIDLLRKNRRTVCGGSTIRRHLDAACDRSELRSVFDIEAGRAVFAWAADRVRHTVEPATWEAFWRTAVQNESADEAAKALSMSVGAVYVARCRTLARIKRLVAEYREGEA